MRKKQTNVKNEETVSEEKTEEKTEETTEEKTEETTEETDKPPSLEDLAIRAESDALVAAGVARIARYRATINHLSPADVAALNQREAAYDLALPEKQRSAAFAWLCTYIGVMYPGLRSAKGRASYLAGRGLTPITARPADFKAVYLIAADGKVRKDAVFLAGVELARARVAGITNAEDVEAIAAHVGGILAGIARDAKANGANAKLIKITDNMIASAIMGE